jgi:hypothetical protein
MFDTLPWAPLSVTCKPTDSKVKLLGAVMHVTVYYASILHVTPQCGLEREGESYYKALNKVTTWYLVRRTRKDTEEDYVVQ